MYIYNIYLIIYKSGLYNHLIKKLKKNILQKYII